MDAAARLKEDGNADTAMMLTARAGREIVEAIEANTATIKSEIGDVKEALKSIENKIDGNIAALERIENKIDGNTVALERLEDKDGRRQRHCKAY